jgi:EAL domain-containing protein (putative c-di-GMP-specific phosphodiesterase class I)
VGEPASNELPRTWSAQTGRDEPQGAAGSLEALCTLVDPAALSVVFQPIVSLETGQTFAYEALVRCRTEGLREPPVLFARAVAAGCVGRLGRTIREIAVPHAGGTPLFVNIHPAELSEAWLVRPDDPIFRHSSDVFLEVTESAPLSHYELCMSVLAEIRSRAAVHLVVDDLGAGHSNLLRIADLEPRMVKLDRQLVANLHRQPRKRDLVAAVVELCVRLGAAVVAEGVETFEEYAALRETSAHYGQGYLFARPGFPLPAVPWPPRPSAGSTLPPPLPRP